MVVSGFADLRCQRTYKEDVMKDVDAPKGTTAFVDIVFDPESSVSGKGYRGRGRAMWLLVAYSQTVVCRG